MRHRLVLRVRVVHRSERLSVGEHKRQQHHVCRISVPDVEPDACADGGADNGPYAEPDDGCAHRGPDESAYAVPDDVRTSEVRYNSGIL